MFYFYDGSIAAHVAESADAADAISANLWDNATVEQDKGPAVINKRLRNATSGNLNISW